ncbi:hypothetical protein Pla163_23750 [Planctomycetes bacterium Pla163]|uniref:Uncharacterized protein n=1 Tax=Rohdeia mirabilis TaxID=2528008 RepID=A0A518D1A6_9BACT|nr:hypothetical protein Pla163_23750 [Planctomycetes bacterium Pla163]
MRSTTILSAILISAASAATLQAQSTVRPVPRIPLPLDWRAADSAETPVFTAVDSAASNGSTQVRAARFERGPVLAEPTLERRVEVEAFGSLLPGAMVETGGGDVSTARFGWRARLLQQTDGGGTLGIEFENEAAFYDFGLSSPIVGTDTDPFNDVYRTRLASTYYGRVASDLSYFHGFEITIAGEPETGLADSTILGGTSGLAFHASENVQITGGLMAFTRLEDDAVLLPFIGLDWQVNESLRITAEGNRVALDAQLNDAVDLEVYAVYDQRQFRLEDGGGLTAPAFRDEQIDLGATLGLAVGEDTRIEFGVGFTAWRELTTLADGATVLEVELDPQPFASIGLTVGF